MSSSGGMKKVSMKKRAEIVNSILCSPASEVIDIVDYVVAGAVIDKTIVHFSEAAVDVLKKNNMSLDNDRSMKLKHVKGLVIEHVVPVKVLRSWLMDRRNAISLEEIEEALRLCPVAMITVDENKKLNAAGFCSKMPDGEYDVLSGNPWTRYRAAGIKMHESMSRLRDSNEDMNLKIDMLLDMGSDSLVPVDTNEQTV